MAFVACCARMRARGDDDDDDAEVLLEVLMQAE